MILRQMKRAVRNGAWVLEPAGKVEARSEFQRGRLTEAVTAARLYLQAETTTGMGQALGRTSERAAQIVRLGINYMTSVGWLHPVEGPVKPQSKLGRKPKVSGRGRD